MQLYLIRHAQPVETNGGTDPTLSSAGQSQAVKLGRMFVRLGITFDTASILTSDRRRAERTGNIIAKSLRLAQSPPPTEVRPIRQFPASNATTLLGNIRTVVAEENPTSMFVVWHFPAVGEAFNLLVGSNLLAWPNIFGATAHITCDELLQDGSGTFQWFILPELLP